MIEQLFTIIIAELFLQSIQNNDRKFYDNAEFGHIAITTEKSRTNYRIFDCRWKFQTLKDKDKNLTKNKG